MRRFKFGCSRSSLESADGQTTRKKFWGAPVFGSCRCSDIPIRYSIGIQARRSRFCTFITPRRMSRETPDLDTALYFQSAELRCRNGGRCYYRFGRRRIGAENESPLTQRAFVKHCQFWKIWSGRRDSNPRPRPWQGRALPLSYTRIREIGGDRSPATGRAMPNAHRECNRPGGARNRPYQAIGRQIDPKPAGPGSADCKLGFQAPIRARTC
jgi:hypothetical protein